MRRIAGIAFLIIANFALTATWCGHANAQKRVAFVVGTDNYDNLSREHQLQRAVNDARAVAAAFKALGFDVVAAENLVRGAFNAQFQSFLDKLAAGDTAVFYYAGHGVEIEGLNFLLPRDAPNVKYGRQEQIKRESLSVAELLLDLRGRNPAITLVILDACRDNPLVPEELRSAGGPRGGLAPLKGEPPKGTFIMYSAGAGESALDRLPGNDPDRLNSIFTRKLVPLLGTKGLALHEMARQLRADVLELASTVPHEQRPAYYDGVVGKFCLAGCEAETALASKKQSEAAEAWGATKDATSIAVLEAFAARYKESFYADLARSRIDELRKGQAGGIAPSKIEPGVTKVTIPTGTFYKGQTASQRVTGKSDMVGAVVRGLDGTQLGTVEAVILEGSMTIGLLFKHEGKMVGLRIPSANVVIDGRLVTLRTQDTTAILAALNAYQIGPSGIQEEREPADANAGKQRNNPDRPDFNSLVFLGEKQIGFGADRDTIKTNQPDDSTRAGRFKALGVLVEKSDIFLTALRLTYFNNFVEEFRVDQMIREGGYLPLDLRGQRSLIRSIEIVYRSRPGVTGQGLIKVYGVP